MESSATVQTLPDGGIYEVGTVSHEGHDYAAAGAVVDMREGRLVAYISGEDGAVPLTRSSWRVVTWGGEILSSHVNIVSSRRETRGYTTDRWYYVRFEYLGTIWSGMTAGPGMYVKARRTALRSIFG